MGTARTAYEKRNWFRQRFELAKAKAISLNEDVLIAEFCSVFNSTSATAKEIIRSFELINIIKKHEGDLVDPIILEESLSEGPSEELSDEEKEILNEQEVATECG